MLWIGYFGTYGPRECYKEYPNRCDVLEYTPCYVIPNGFLNTSFGKTVFGASKSRRYFKEYAKSIHVLEYNSRNYINYGPLKTCFGKKVLKY